MQTQGKTAKKQKTDGKVLWFTGLSGSGKSTIGLRVAAELKAAGVDVEYLDGDEVRSVFPQIGFSRKDREEHVRRIGYMASRLAAHGIWVVAAFVSPYREGRDFVRSLCRYFVEIHMATPLSECERRDVKGLYNKARKGEIKQFTGIDDPYEPPQKPELFIDTTNISVDEACRIVLDSCLAEANHI